MEEIRKESGQTKIQNRRYALFSILICLIVGFTTTPYIGCATMSYVILLVGLSLRKKNPQSHAQLMKIGMGIDILLVLILEATRSATATAVAFKLGPLQQAHILFSTLAVVGYIPLFLIGNKILKNKHKMSDSIIHLRIRMLTFAFRTLGFILMFSMLTK